MLASLPIHGKCHIQQIFGGVLFLGKAQVAYFETTSLVRIQEDKYIFYCEYTIL